jgi:hypothetical protein
VRRLLYAAYFFEVGLLLVVLPWTTFWDHNYLFEWRPVIEAWARNYYLRGAVSGLGLVNLGFGFAEVASVLSGRLGSASRERGFTRPTHAP